MTKSPSPSAPRASPARRSVKSSRSPSVRKSFPSPAACLRRPPSRSNASAGPAPRCWTKPRRPRCNTAPPRATRLCANGSPAPEQERRDHPSQPGADHHRFAAGPGSAGQGADRRRQQGAGGNPQLPGRAAGVLAVPAGVFLHAGRRGRHRHRRTDSRTAGRRPLHVLPAQFPEPHRPAHAAGTAQGAAGKSHRRRRAGGRGRPLRRAQLQRRRAAQPAVDGAGTCHLHGLVLQGAGPGPAPGLRGRARGIAGQAGPGQAGRRPAHAFVHPAHRP